ncbi:hypothetical protein DB347_09160 [Opitutaceae bacterium EW11]|nr:hypothetical protein DB347_09160 [Opitutaceae bacterium EW11]
MTPIRHLEQPPGKRRSRSLRREALAAYEQTRFEYEFSRSGIGSTAHRDLVRLALISGKRVPAHVLADYPGLVREAQPGMTRPMAD